MTVLCCWLKIKVNYSFYNMSIVSMDARSQSTQHVCTRARAFRECG